MHIMLSQRTKKMRVSFLRYNAVQIATEFCEGGTLLDKIIRLKSFSEKKASVYLRTMLSAVHYMHSINIVHRDIKACNMVFDKAGSNGVLQLIDFGDSQVVQEKSVYQDFVGTIHYVEFHTVVWTC